MTLTDKAHQVLAEIAAVLALAEKATPGPWRVQAEAVYADTGSRNEPIMRFHPSAQHHLDNAFIAASRTLLPTAMRCLKTAIEGLVEISQRSPLSGGYAASDALAALCDQWEASK